MSWNMIVLRSPRGPGSPGVARARGARDVRARSSPRRSCGAGEVHRDAQGPFRRDRLAQGRPGARLGRDGRADDHPDSSAIGMNVVGRTRPRSGAASAPAPRRPATPVRGRRSAGSRRKLAAREPGKSARSATGATIARCIIGSNTGEARSCRPPSPCTWRRRRCAAALGVVAGARDGDADARGDLLSSWPWTRNGRRSASTIRVATPSTSDLRRSC